MKLNVIDWDGSHIPEALNCNVNLDRGVANTFAGFDALKLRLVLIFKTHLFEKRNQVGFIMAIDRQVNIVSKPLTACKPTHGQTSDEPRANAKLTAPFQKLFECLPEFSGNIHAQSIGEKG